MQMVSLFYIIGLLIFLGFIGLNTYILILVIKALKTYIKKNS